MLIPLTVYTSLSFSMVSYVAFMKQLWFLGTLWQILCGLSTINHLNTYKQYTGKRTISKVDTILAHMVVGVSAYFALTATINPIAFWIFWLCLTYMVVIFYILGTSKFPNKIEFNDRKWEPWHASIHIAAIIGETALFMGYIS